ncbi:hypothetical protein F0562_010947 [Nyssa sinensis]|uniref:Bulb-type lectin domain-containing protein n=1 Tax=Nyssa sinensis TaxID=561372 RepID=A0A5J5A2T8_9ASTE|nr:hypothetical protein F0562_010947 [Nyssa sinensis]
MSTVTFFLVERDRIQNNNRNEDHPQRNEENFSMGSYVLLILTSILSSSLLPVFPSEDTIAAGKSISFNQTIISASGNFALGFFSPGNSTNSYLGVWYNTIPKHTVIWVVHRENPILEENSHAVLALSSSGNLMLLDGRREAIWSTNVSAVNLSVNSTTAVLKDSGNFVLKQDEDTVLWQSFDYPTDTFMSGRKISLNRKTGLQILLTSWANDEDPQPGMFSIGIDPKRRPRVYIWKQHDPYWKCQKPNVIFMGTVVHLVAVNKMALLHYANLMLMLMSEETSANCLNGFGDLMDLVHNDTTGQDLYVSLHGSEFVGNAQTGKLMDRKRSLIAIAAGLSFHRIASYLWFWPSLEEEKFETARED